MADEATLQKIFAKLDINGNGTIEKPELVEACKKFGDEAVATAITDKIDTNKDGVVSFDEFKAGFAKIDMNKRLAVNALAIAAGVGLPNSAFCFIKPHAVTDAVKALVKAQFAEKNIRIVSEGSIDGATIDKDMLIDQHYYAIASKATLLTPDKLPVPADKFEGKFGIPWQKALDDGLVFNALDACKKLGVEADDLDKLWGTAKKADKLIKFGGGFYCGFINDIYIFNGFFMSMRSKFTGDAKIHTFVIEWDAKRTPWEDFRGKVLGPTDPADAPEGALRFLVAKDWQALGLPGPCNTGDNAVHASASPFEAMAERTNWLESTIEADSFGKALLQAGIPKATIEAWSVDPVVAFSQGPDGQPAGKFSLFDLLEDLDTRACVAKCQAIYAYTK